MCWEKMMKEKAKNINTSTVNKIFCFIFKTISLYFFKCKKIIDCKKLKAATVNKIKLIILSKCGVWDSTKLRFTKKEETSKLKLKTFLSKIALLGDMLF